MRDVFNSPQRFPMKNILLLITLGVCPGMKFGFCQYMPGRLFNGPIEKGLYQWVLLKGYYLLGREMGPLIEDKNCR